MDQNTRAVYDYLCGQEKSLKEWSMGAQCYKRMVEFVGAKFPGRRDLRILEIGTCRGLSALLLSQFGDVYTLDVQTYDGMQKVLDDCPRIPGSGSIVRLVSRSQDRARGLVYAIRFDLAFIDGCHVYDHVRRDVSFARSVSSTIVFHDYNAEKFPGCVKAIDECRSGAKFTWKPDCSLAMAEW